MTTSWERSIRASILDIQDKLLVYLESDDFESDWNAWNFVRSDVKWITICGSFVYGIPQTKIISEVMYNALLSHLILIRHLHIQILPCMYITHGVVDSIHGTLYENLIKVYKDIWHHAEYIQIRWKRAISDPRYALCRKRLLREFKNID